jgi:lipoate-protein ligase A
MDYAKKEKIEIVRRTSGGGAIFVDMGTFLYTLIQPRQKEIDVWQTAQKTIAGPVIRALNKMGVPALLSGRNDILAGGKKISGIAQYARFGMLCTHGSLLYDANLEMLASALRVDDDKIRSKAIKSVRGRVKNINEYVALPIREFREILKRSLIGELGAREYIFTDGELMEIEKIRDEKYGNPEWTFGNAPAFSFFAGRRFPEGKIEIYLDVVKGFVASLSIRGDFLGVVPIRALEEKLENTMFQYDAFERALDNVEFGPFFGGITKEQLLSVVFKQEEAQ